MGSIFRFESFIIEFLLGKTFFRLRPYLYSLIYVYVGQIYMGIINAEDVKVI